MLLLSLRPADVQNHLEQLFLEHKKQTVLYTTSNCVSSLQCILIYKVENMLYLSGKINHTTYCKPLTETASDVIHSSLINQTEMCLGLRFINLSKNDQRWHFEDDL